jgi:hypothetical protein
MKLPSMPRTGVPVSETVKDIINYLRATRVTSFVGGQVKETPGGTSLVISAARTMQDAAKEELCAFGSIETWIDNNSGGTPKATITGGIIYCGQTNLTVEREEIDLSTDWSELYYLSVDCTSYTDDDGEILLPGIDSCDSDAGSVFMSMEYVGGAQYPDNSNPTASNPSGTIIIPIGKVTVENGKAKIEDARCGDIRIQQCSGNLYHSRA